MHEPPNYTETVSSENVVIDDTAEKQIYNRRRYP